MKAVRIRHPQFSGREDKFYAPHDDIRQCTYGIIMGALEAASTQHPDLMDAFGSCAVAMAEFNNRCLTEKKPAYELLGDMVAKLKEYPEAWSLISQAITLGMLQYWAVAARETTFDKDIAEDQIRDLTVQGLLLSALGKDDREAVRSILRKYETNRLGELDRPLQTGKVIKPYGETFETERAGLTEPGPGPGEVVGGQS